jgi:hypothetical protein
MVRNGRETRNTNPHNTKKAAQPMGQNDSKSEDRKNIYPIKPKLIIIITTYRKSTIGKVRSAVDTLIMCKIWGLYGGDYEECRVLGCVAV